MDRLPKKEQQTSRTSLQVLPRAGSDDCWPRLLGQILFVLFGGKNPAIRHLKIDDIFDQVPDDLIECWACCFWAVQASISAIKSEQSLSGLSNSVLSLGDRLYKLTGLTPDELLGDQVIQVMARMGDRFAARLGLDSEALVDAHRMYVDALTRSALRTEVT